MKSLCTSAALMLTTLILAVAAGTTIATAQTYTDLHNFNAGSEPSSVFRHHSPGARRKHVQFHPQTWTRGLGDVFKITPAGTVTVMHRFRRDRRVRSRGRSNSGHRREVLRHDQRWRRLRVWDHLQHHSRGSPTTLYSFTNGADGGVPVAPPIQGVDGTSTGPRMENANNGAVYKITPAGVFTTLHSFAGTDGANPIAPLVQAANGNFYGTTGLDGATGRHPFQD